VKLTIHLHLVPRSKNEWSDTSTPQYAFTAWCIVKYRDNFTFTLKWNIRLVLGHTQPHIQWLFPQEIESSKPEANLLSSYLPTEFKNTWSFISCHEPISFWCGA